MKLVNLILLLTASLFIYSCSDSNKPNNALPSNATILAFGDSLTYGTGASKGKDYPTLLASLTGLKIINAGIPGEISGDGLVRLPTLLDEHKPELLILIHGGNDILRKLPRTNLKSNLRAMLDAADSRNIPAVALGVPEPGLFLKSAEVYKQLENETEIPFELSILPEIMGDRSLKSDIAHPNAKGYQEMAKQIFKFLVEQGFIAI